ncbi:MAG: hypothetical protein R3A47_06850 [Polyangiales bacterium]
MIDATTPPLLFVWFRHPRLTTAEDHHRYIEIATELMEEKQSYFALAVTHPKGEVISAEHRHIYTEWLENNHERIAEYGRCTFMVAESRIVRATARVVYWMSGRKLAVRFIPSMSDAIRSVMEFASRTGVENLGEVETKLEELRVFVDNYRP